MWSDTEPKIVDTWNGIFVLCGESLAGVPRREPAPFHGLHSHGNAISRKSSLALLALGIRGPTLEDYSQLENVGGCLRQ